METLIGKKIGDRIDSTNGRYFHVIESIGKEFDRGLGEKAVFINTRVYSCFGANPRLVGNDKIMFTKVGDHFITNHVN